MWPVLHDRFSEARTFYEVGLERSRSEGDVTSVQGTLIRLAEIACWTGDWDDADRVADESMALADRTSTSALLRSSLYVRGLVDAHLGRLDEARAAVEETVAAFGATNQGVLGHWLLGFVALCRGDPATADREYTRAQAILDEQGQREPARYRFQPDHVEAVVELGDLTRARELLAKLEQRAAVFPRPWILATNARCRALLAAADGELTAAAAAVEEALAHHEQLEMPFERARTLLVQGRILRRLKQKRDARAALEEALAVFEQARCRDVGANHRGRAEPARDASRPGRAHAHRAAHREARRLRSLQPGDLDARLRVAENRRSEPGAGLPEARHLVARPTRPGAGQRGRADFVGSSLFSPAPRGPSVVAMEGERESFVAECYWPDVDDADLATLDRRIDRVIAELAHGSRSSVPGLDPAPRGRGRPLPVRGTRGQRP